VRFLGSLPLILVCSEEAVAIAAAFAVTIECGENLDSPEISTVAFLKYQSDAERYYLIPLRYQL
jgi:hypothetical protein